MRVAVFGSAGFMGRTLLQQLRNSGHTVVPFSSKAKYFVPEAMTHCDTLDTSQIDAGVYLSQSPHWRSPRIDWQHLWAINVQAALAAAEYVRDRGSVRFIYASSGNVYGPSFAPLRENAPLNRSDPYALSKVQAEEVLGLMSDHMSAAFLRFFTVFGRNQQDRLFPTLVSRVASGAPIHLQPLLGEGGETSGLRLSVIHVDDACKVISKLLLTNVAGPMNVAGPVPTSVREWSIAIGRRLGREPNFALAESHRQGDLIADTSALMSSLDASFLTLTEGVERSC